MAAIEFPAFMTLNPRIVKAEDWSDSGIRRLRLSFANGWGVSIIQGNGVPGYEEGLFELAALDPSGEIMLDQVLNRLTEDSVMQLVDAISLLDQGAIENPIKAILDSEDEMENRDVAAR